MAKMENLDDLPMTRMEELLKGLIQERPDISGKILSSQELAEYVAWMITHYGQTYGNTTLEMLPYFTPDNGMTKLAEEVASKADSKKVLTQLSWELAEQNDEGYLPQSRDISVGRMLRYFPAQWHTTTYFQVFYAFSGECPIHFQNETIVLKNGAVLITAPGIVHACPCYADNAVLAFYMMRANIFRHVFWNQLGDDNLLSRFFRIGLESEFPTSYLYFETDNDPEVRHVLLQIYQEHQLEEPYSPQMINSLMRLFFLLILRRYEGTARLPRTEHFFWKHQFSAILSYIQTHYQEATLNSVAEKFNYSPKQVGRIVKDCTGESFGDLIRSMKMKKAAELLSDRHYPPEQVAPLVGFATVNSFYRSFKDYYGMPPLRWVSNQQES